MLHFLVSTNYRHEFNSIAKFDRTVYMRQKDKLKSLFYIASSFFNRLQFLVRLSGAIQSNTIHNVVITLPERIILKSSIETFLRNARRVCGGEQRGGNCFDDV